MPPLNHLPDDGTIDVIKRRENTYLSLVKVNTVCYPVLSKVLVCLHALHDESLRCPRNGRSRVHLFARSRYIARSAR
ncbi:uncharacterized protein SCHCODRAFT_02607956 [Schizophyllum commune H4-8]|uniref:Expressed protein n=1 Tax=Schizophyllum commune (strain H4-8 / FGSC 9210) TaxID=578458 RepID=D8PV83_SCHCM|nr:uncharacterized protein SCHCODRAFT_02607956 [Schizophyllum commune H4-8]KAI5900457.1 hypothetical protein SCHCODRAFT_02607956 [Schizophyllum commune H4-8]